MHDGEVRLSGEVETKADAELIPTFVQRVPGVVSVLSKLRWRRERIARPRRWHERASVRRVLEQALVDRVAHELGAGARAGASA